jgi:hypothetical protein
VININIASKNERNIEAVAIMPARPFFNFPASKVIGNAIRGNKNIKNPKSSRLFILPP